MIDYLLNLTAKFNFWRSRKFIKHERDYIFMLDEREDKSVSIKILRRYPGVIVSFTNVHMSSESQMSYDMTVIANPANLDVETLRFKRFVGRIFTNILVNAIENATKEVDDESRDNNSEQSDSERTVYEEGDSVSEAGVLQRKPRKKAIRTNKGIHPKV